MRVCEARGTTRPAHHLRKAGRCPKRENRLPRTQWPSARLARVSPLDSPTRLGGDPLPCCTHDFSRSALCEQTLSTRLQPPSERSHASQTRRLRIALKGARAALAQTPVRASKVVCNGLPVWAGITAEVKTYRELRKNGTQKPDVIRSMPLPCR